MGIISRLRAIQNLRRESRAIWLYRSISRQNQLQIQEIVMITIAVIAAVIGTTELLFELVDNSDRKHHDRNNS